MNLSQYKPKIREQFEQHIEPLFEQFIRGKIAELTAELEDYNQALEESISKRNGKPVEHSTTNGTTLEPFTGNGSSPVIVNKGHGTKGWKYLVDDVLKKADGEYLAAKDIVKKVLEINPTIATEQIATKSVGSALSSYSKKKDDRYLKTLKKGLTHYCINKTFPEFLMDFYN